MRLLVTGGEGFIGSALVRQALEAGHRVVVLDARTYAAHPDNLAGLPVQAIQGDVRDRGLLDRLFDHHRFEGVLHLAAESHVDRSIDGPADVVATNVQGTLTLLEAARAWWERTSRPPFRLVAVSTDEVYGSLGPTGRFTESSPLDPNSPYAASKAAADHLVLAWQRTWGLPALITRGSNTLGPRQFPEKLVPRMILSAVHGNHLPVYGDGRQVRDWLDVEDHGRGLLAALERGRPGRVYNLGGGQERTNLELVTALADAVDRHLPGATPRREAIVHVADRPGHDRRYALDCTRAEEELGWRPHRSLEASVECTVAWYLQNRAWWEPLLAAHPLDERLGRPR